MEGFQISRDGLLLVYQWMGYCNSRRGTISVEELLYHCVGFTVSDLLSHCKNYCMSERITVSAEQLLCQWKNYCMA